MNLSKKVLPLLLSVTLISSPLMASSAFAATAGGDGSTPVSAAGSNSTAAREALQGAIEKAGAYTDSAKYSADSWSTFTAALEAANICWKNPEATADNFTVAASNLNNAIEGLNDAAGARENLQNAIETANSLQEANYTADSWKDFQTALNNAVSCQKNPEAATKDLTAATTNLQNAIKGLVAAPAAPVTPVAPVSPVTPIVTPEPNAPATFVSDTTSNFSVNDAYTFKITSKDGKAPTFVVGTAGVFTVDLVKADSGDYYFKLTAIGKPGQSAGIYVDGGQRLLVVTVKANAYYASDTWNDVQVNGAYTFKITSRTGKAPTFVVGTAGVFSVSLVKTSGNDYYFKITAIGKSGSGAGVYIDGCPKLLVAAVK